MKEYGKEISRNQKENIVNVLTNEFPAGSGKKTYSQCVFIEEDASDYKPTESFIEMLKNDDFYTILKELVEFGISRYERDYSDCYENSDLVLYQKYTYEEVCRLLNWEKNLSSVMNGYMLDKKTKTYPVFINYDKSDDISDTTKYEDHFVEGFRDRLIAISKSGRKLQSDDVQNFLKAKERGIQVELFVRKNKDDKISKEFYYLGHMTASGNAREFTMANTEKSAVEIEWILDVPVAVMIFVTIYGIIGVTVVLRGKISPQMSEIVCRWISAGSLVSSIMIEWIQIIRGIIEDSKLTVKKYESKKLK